MTFDVAAALLQAPQNKKKRRYILMMYSSKHTALKDSKTVERAVSSALRDHTLLRLEDPDEGLKVLMVKNIEMLILDTSFLADEQVAVEYALEAKKRKKCPILFITNSENKLIRQYREQMYMYEELDDFLVSPVDVVDLQKRLKRFAMTEGRASKRFSLDEKVLMYRLDTNAYVSGTLSDISMVGFGLKLEGNDIFNRNEQLQIQLPLAAFNIFHPQYGEILKLSGRIRRVSIDGLKVGCSIEHLTPMQSDCLLRVIEVVARKIRVAKREAAKANKPLLTDVS